MLYSWQLFILWEFHLHLIQKSILKFIIAFPQPGFWETNPKR